MHSTKIIVCLLALSALMRAQTDITTKRNQYCTGSQLDLNMTQRQFADMRRERTNIFYDNINEIIEYYNEGSVAALFRSFLPWAILLLVWMLACFISFIVFIVLCFGKYKNETNRTGIYTTFGCLVFWAYIPLFAAIVVFLAKAQHKYNNVYCSVYDVPATLLNGINSESDKFLGLQNLQTMLTNFRGELPDMTALAANFNTIFVANPPTYTNSAWNSLINYVDKYEGTKILNGNGVLSVPNSIQQITPAVSNRVDTDFTDIDTTAQKILLTSEEGRRYQNSNYRNTIDTSLQVATAKLNELITELQALFDPLTNYSEKAITWSIVGYWAILGVGAGIALLSFIALMILCCICTWQRCERGRFPAKLLLLVVGLLTLSFTVLVFIIMIGSVSSSSFCGVIGSINGGNYDVFNSLNRTVSSDLITLFRTCGSSDETGTLGDLLVTTSTQREAYNSANTFLDGLLMYNTFQTTLRSSNGSQGISDAVANFNSLSVGTKSDFVQVDRALEALNEEISCDKQVFYLTSSSCSVTADKGKKCQGINETTNYTAPSCTKNASEANQYFTNLKAYLTEEQALTKSLITDLNGTTEDTPRTRFANAQNALDGLAGSYNSIYNSISTTLDVGTSYNSSQSELIDCKIFRRNLLTFENESCFGFNYYVYIILVLAAVSSVLLLLMAWCMCCALREEGTYDEASIIEDPYMDKQVIKEVGDVMDFEEREIIPNY